ncbi:MAG: hypothetical protein ABI472_08720 [Ginsengibacter sp.]
MLSQKQQSIHGNFPVLAQKAAHQIKDAKVIIIPGVGRIPHIQTTAIFNKNVVDFFEMASRLGSYRFLNKRLMFSTLGTHFSWSIKKAYLRH